jgi:hypothetical protein
MERGLLISTSTGGPGVLQRNAIAAPKEIVKHRETRALPADLCLLGCGGGGEKRYSRLHACPDLAGIYT